MALNKNALEQALKDGYKNIDLTAGNASDQIAEIQAQIFFDFVKTGTVTVASGIATDGSQTTETGTGTIS